MRAATVVDCTFVGDGYGMLIFLNEQFDRFKLTGACFAIGFQVVSRSAITRVVSSSVST